MGTNRSGTALGQRIDDSLRSWIMVALTGIFVCLYAVALFGWLPPLTDVSMIVRLEPIIFVIIGYYFGRLPGEQTEKTLKDEIGRQTEKADQAQQEKEQAQQGKGVLEEKVKNTKAALASAIPGAPTAGFAVNLSGEGDSIPPVTLRQSVIAALNVLES
jgi:hypothetical protein